MKGKKNSRKTHEFCGKPPHFKDKKHFEGQTPQYKGKKPLRFEGKLILSGKKPSF